MSRARGFSLVELMVAIVLGLLVTQALVAMFVGVRTAGRASSGVAALADSGRFALNTIEQVVRGAGNMACNSTSPISLAGMPIVRQVSLLNGGASPLISDYGEPLEGYEAVGSNPGNSIIVSSSPVAAGAADDWVTTNALGNVLDGALINPPLPVGELAPVGSPIAGSDILVVHETMSGLPADYTTIVATGAGAFTVNSSTVFSGAGGQIAAISNCVQTEVFQVATFTPGSGTGSVALNGAAVAPGNSAGTLSSNIDFGVGSQVMPIDTIVFYIGVGADGDGALYRYDTNGGALGGPFSINQELVPDVENMQILYGVETAVSQSTQTVAQYVTADQVSNYSITGDFNGVISVKVALLVSSPPSSTPPPSAVNASPPLLLGTNWAMQAVDSRIRKVYEQTMFLRNMSL